MLGPEVTIVTAPPCAEAASKAVIVAPTGNWSLVVTLKPAAAESTSTLPMMLPMESLFAIRSNWTLV